MSKFRSDIHFHIFKFPKIISYISSMPHQKRKSKLDQDIKENLLQRNGFRSAIFDVNGNSYTGEWKDDKKHGYGIMMSKSESLCYSGNWVNDKRDGYGTLSWLDPVSKKYRCLYTGTWTNNRKNGSGTHNYTDGGQYSGEWKNGKRKGWGEMTYADGGKYSGHWLKDKRHGSGTMEFSDGSEFQGEWVQDIMDGQGVLKKADGTVFEGVWINGLKNGQGKYYFTDSGVEITGVWVDDIPRCGTLQVVTPNAVSPLAFDIPECTLADPMEVIEQAIQDFLQKVPTSQVRKEQK